MSTQFTIGLANQVASLTGEPIDGIFFTSEEWCILGQKKYRDDRRESFSTLGDSGSCVWDVQSRISGMLTSVSDTTFVTPIGWLLEDMRAYGYDVELVGEEENN